jgi:branched-chain amino acid transport system permease protein
MGSVSGSVIAGIVLGEAQALFTAFLPDITRAFSYSNAFSVFVLMVVLMFRPTGIFGRRHLRME